MRVILEPGTTDGVTSAEFNVAKDQSVTLVLYPEANLGANTATLKIKAPDGSFVTATDKDGDVVLSDTRNVQVVDGVGVYRLDVATRTLSWGIGVTG